jgi:hypothetical protein
MPLGEPNSRTGIHRRVNRVNFHAEGVEQAVAVSGAGGGMTGVERNQFGPSIHRWLECLISVAV